MASLGSYIRSAARATFSAYRSATDPLAAGRRLRGADVRDPGRVRGDRRRADDAAGARPVQRRGRSSARRSAAAAARTRPSRPATVDAATASDTGPASATIASAEHAQIRIFDNRRRLAVHPGQVGSRAQQAPSATPQLLGAPDRRRRHVHAARLPRRRAHARSVKPGGELDVLLYARPLSDVDHTLARSASSCSSACSAARSWRCWPGSRRRSGRCARSPS